MARTAFVTGATGFLGRHLVEQLVAGGWEVTCFHRSSSNTSALASLPVALRAGVLHENASVAAAMPERCDAVFHVAANTSGWAKRNAEQTRDNVEGTKAVVDAAIERGAKRLVQTSTSGVYGLSLGFADQMELRETSPRRGGQSRVNYERTKFLAEEEAMAAAGRGLEVVVLQPPHIMGKYDTVNWSRLISLAHRGELPGVPPGTGQYVSAAEVARIHIVAAERAKNGERYLLPGAQATFLEVVQIVCELSQRKVGARVLPPFLLAAVGRIGVIKAAFTGREPDLTPETARMTSVDSRIVSTKAHDELGYEPQPLRAMVEESYRWLKEQGMLDKKS